jgi:hypothetical protein
MRLSPFEMMVFSKKIAKFMNHKMQVGFQFLQNICYTAIKLGYLIAGD